MALKAFSKKEAISHGFKMTKKYFGVIFSIILVCAVFEIMSGQLNVRAGGGSISKKDVQELYKEPVVADDFYQHLIAEDYIKGELRVVQEKLKNIKNSAELSLPAAFEGDREKIFNFLEPYTYRLPFPPSVYYFLCVALWIISMIVEIGIVKIGLMLSRDQKPSISELFSNGSLFIKYLLAYICYGLAVLGGFLLLIVPGIIFAIALGMFGYFIVDKKMGPIESLKASRVLTKGVRWQLFWFGGLLVLLNIGGLLCLVVGLLFTIPISLIASTYVYDKLRQQDEIASP